MFKNNPNWYYLPANKYRDYGQWCKIGGRTEEERIESRKRLVKDHAAKNAA